MASNPKRGSAAVESLFAPRPDWARSSIEAPSVGPGLGEMVGDVLGAWVEVSRVQLEGQRELLTRVKRSKGQVLHLSFREAAIRLGVGRDAALKALVARGELKTITVQGRTRIPISEVERLAAEGFDTNSPAPRKKGKGGASSKSNQAFSTRGTSGTPGKAIKGLKF